MAQTETIKLHGKRFTATKLTVKQIRDVLEEVESKDYRPGLIDRLFVDSIPQPAFLSSLGVELDELDELSPEEVKELMEAVATVNPTYADMEKRMSAKPVGGEQLDGLQKTLKGLASTLSG